MGFIYNIVKANCPDCLFPLMRSCYRTIKLPKTLMNKYKMSRIISRAEKLRPYYRDELSLSLLSDCEKYLRVREENIFTDRAIEQGWKFHEIVANPTIYEYIDHDKFSGIVVIHDGENSSRLKYVTSLLKLSEWANKYRILTLNEFMNSALIQKSELIVPIIGTKNLVSFLRHAYNTNLLYSNNIYSGGLMAIREDIQYFDVFDPVDDEIIIDAGAYNGATAKQFLQWGGGKVKKIYSFEFDPVNAAKCEENLKDLRDKVTLIKKGTSDKEKRYI